MKRRQFTDGGKGLGRNVPRLEIFAEEIQALDRLRLLEPTSLPKVLRGRPAFRRPNTAIISNAAQLAYERRIERERSEDFEMRQLRVDVKKFLSARDRKLERIVFKLRFNHAKCDVTC